MNQPCIHFEYDQVSLTDASGSTEAIRTELSPQIIKDSIQGEVQ